MLSPISISAHDAQTCTFGLCSAAQRSVLPFYWRHAIAMPAAYCLGMLFEATAALDPAPAAGHVLSMNINVAPNRAFFFVSGVRVQHSRNQRQIHVWHRNHLCHRHILHILERHSSLNSEHDGRHLNSEFCCCSAGTLIYSNRNTSFQCQAAEPGNDAFAVQRLHVLAEKPNIC